MKIIKNLILASLVLALSASLALAKVGVGVGLGKVAIDEPLTPGGVFNLPTLPVLNTGDEAGDYEVEVTFLSEQEELRPEPEWFTFSPQQFPLDAGESQTVEMTLVLPVNARPGDYFAFLEAHPVTKGEGVSIGVAAATKLSFTIKPSGVLGAAIERLRSLIATNAPLSYYLLGIGGGVIVLIVVRRNLDIQVKLKKGKRETKARDKGKSKEEA